MNICWTIEHVNATTERNCYFVGAGSALSGYINGFGDLYFERMAELVQTWRKMRRTWRGRDQTLMQRDAHGGTRHLKWQGLLEVA